jgi:hypothetical protein
MATGKPAPKKTPKIIVSSKNKPDPRRVESKENSTVAGRKQAILKNLAGLNAKAVAAHKKYDAVSAANSARKAAKKPSAKRLSNAEGNTNGYASKQYPDAKAAEMATRTKRISPKGVQVAGPKTKSVDRNREADMNAKGKRPKGGPGMAASKKK